MKPSGFDIIELFRNNYKPEAHAMNKSTPFYKCVSNA